MRIAIAVVVASCESCSATATAWWIKSSLRDTLGLLCTLDHRHDQILDADIEQALNNGGFVAREPDNRMCASAGDCLGLVETLESPGPFTVFAPTNEAFAKLPPGTVETLLKPENKAMLTKILTYHVVPGRLTGADLVKMVKDGHGKATLKTVEGDNLTVSEQGGKLIVSGEKGGVGEVSIANVMQSNGVIDVVNSVLLPN